MTSEEGHKLLLSDYHASEVAGGCQSVATSIYGIIILIAEVNEAFKEYIRKKSHYNHDMLQRFLRSFSYRLSE